MGRGASGKGDLRAADWLVQEMKRRGAQPFEGTSYTHPFTYAINVFEGEMALGDGKQNWSPGVDYIIHSKSNSGKGKASIVYIDKSDSSRFKNSSLKNKAAVLPKLIFSQWMKKGNTQRLQWLYSAACIVLLTEDKLVMGLSDQVFPTVVFECKQSKWSRKLTHLHWDVEQAVVQHNAQNIVGKIEGTQVKDSFIVFSAHYDHLGAMGNSTYFPGANDNASGVSMVLEWINYFTTHPPKYSILFLLFAGEEAGLKGSTRWVEEHIPVLPQIRFLFNLDLVGTGEEGIMLVNGTLYPAEVERIKEINNQSNGLPYIKTRGPAANSDHYPFYLHKVPCFFLYTLGGIAYYHDVFDKPETLLLTHYTVVFQLITQFQNEW